MLSAISSIAVMRVKLTRRFRDISSRMISLLRVVYAISDNFFPDKTFLPRYGGDIVGRYGAVGAEIGDIKRPEIVGGDGGAAQLDGFAERIGDIVFHIGAHNHRPAAEVDGRNIGGKTFELPVRHHARAVTQGFQFS